MKVKDLRFGNYVKDKGFTVIVAPWAFKGITTRQALTGDIDLEPIPIDERWLIDLGFGETERGDAHIINVGEYDLYVAVNAFSSTLEKDPSWHCSVAIGYGSQPMLIMKMYVHQLQNLYFALTNKELTLISNEPNNN